MSIDLKGQFQMDGIKLLLSEYKLLQGGILLTLTLYLSIKIIFRWNIDIQFSVREKLYLTPSRQATVLHLCNG